jgi:hypothetical protein
MSEHNPETDALTADPGAMSRLDRPITREGMLSPVADAEPAGFEAPADEGHADPAVEGGTRAP